MTDIPQWSAEKAAKLANNEYKSGFWGASDVSNCSSLRAFARYIATNEEQPVDPLELEARKILAKMAWAPDVARKWLSGEWDDFEHMATTMAALRRGIEIGKKGAS